MISLPHAIVTSPHMTQGGFPRNPVLFRNHVGQHCQALMNQVVLPAGNGRILRPDAKPVRSAGIQLTAVDVFAYGWERVAGAVDRASPDARSCI